MSFKTNEKSHPRHRESRPTENVLVLQGGGSLGAFACGVFKALVKKEIRIDIAAGTSMGAINAAIIVGSKSDHPEKELEEFWLEIAESSYKIIPDIHIFDYNSNIRRYVPKQISSASINAAAFGVSKMFIPRWWRLFPTKQNLLYAENENVKQQPYFTDPRNWTYLYDHSPLAKTLDKYINYKKLNLAATHEDLPEVRRLIITAVNVKTSRPLIFDNTKMEIKAKHILASSGYPIYGFPWVEVEEGVSNIAEVESRAKDILFCDKNMENIKMSKLITRQIQLIERLYGVFNQFVDQSNLDTKEVAKIKKEYNSLIENYGAVIKSVTRIVRSELESPSILQNADFSPRTIKELIAQGKKKTLEELEYCETIQCKF